MPFKNLIIVLGLFVLVGFLISPSDAALAQEPIERINVNDQITDIQWSPDGTLIAVAGEDGAYLYNNYLQQIMTLSPSAGSIIKISWSFDSLLLAVVNSHNNTVQIWERDINTNKFSLSSYLYPKHKYANVVAWHPNSARLAILVEDQPSGFNGLLGSIEIWHKTASDWILEKTLVPAKEYIFPDPLLIWSLDGGEIVGVGNGCRVDACSNGDDSFVFILDVETGQTLHTFEFTIPPYSIAWSSRNQLIVGAHEATIVDVVTGQIVNTWKDPDPNFAALHIEWNIDGTKFIVGSESVNELKIIDADTQNVLCSFSNTGINIALDWSPNNRQLIAASEDGDIEIWDAAACPT